MEKSPPAEFEVEAKGASERNPTTEERREWLHLDTELVGVVCAAFRHTTSTQRSVDVGWMG